jgi:S-formylglutathione hydrolase FrmB
MPYEIVVPDSYGASNRLPVLYMLHGRTYHDTAWRLQAYTIITNAVQRSHLLVVFPEGDLSWYYGTFWRRYLTRDLTRQIESNWFATATRGIGGFCMGGYGALYAAGIGAAYDGTEYRSVSSMSGAFVESGIPEYFGDLGGPVLGRADLADAVAARAFPLLIDCGNEDVGDFFSLPNYNLAGKNDALRNELLARGRVLWQTLWYYRPTGGHTWNYWRSRIPAHFGFHDNALNAPVVAITSHAAVVTIAVVTNHIAIAGTAAGDNGVSSVTWRVNVRGLSASGVASGTLAWSAAVPLLSTGQVTIGVTAFSPLAYSNTVWMKVHYSDAPAVVITSQPGTAAAIVTDALVRVAGTAQASSGISSVTWRVQGPKLSATGVAAGTNDWVADVPLAIGKNTVTITARSFLGAAGTATKSFIRRAISFRIRTVRVKARALYIKTSDITHGELEGLTNGAGTGFVLLGAYYFAVDNAALWKRSGAWNARYRLPKSPTLNGYLQLNGNPRGDWLVLNLTLPRKPATPPPALTNFLDVIALNTNLPLSIQLGPHEGATNLLLQIRGTKQPWGLFQAKGPWLQ